MATTLLNSHDDVCVCNCGPKDIFDGILIIVLLELNMDQQMNVMGRQMMITCVCFFLAWWMLYSTSSMEKKNEKVKQNFFLIWKGNQRNSAERNFIFGGRKRF